ncbi:MAG: GGDEF domain-containing protein [Betaproteobacteria bacterium]|nr:GGDEF domain-containing protein [Betaproteobacteria bacterium]
MNDVHTSKTGSEPTLRDWRRIFVSFFSEIQAKEYFYLLSQSRHPYLLAVKRTETIISRVRLIALLFAIFTPLWGVVDYLVFPARVWVPMDLLRIFTGLAFFALFLHCTIRHKSADAYLSLFLLFFIPSVFYPASQYVLTNLNGDPISQLAMVGYTFLPFVLITALAIFPLTVRETMMLSLMILIAKLSGIMLPHQIDLTEIISTLWLLALLGGIAATAGVGQLAFMVALVRQTIRDAITGCFTRVSGEELLALQFAIAQRSKTALSLAFIDLDHFKSVNDQFGHEAGDIVLRQAAIAITRELRDSDFLVRWGGEEFLLIMPNTSLAHAKTAMERLCRFGLCKRPDGTIMTASIGIAEAWSDAVSDLGQLIDLSDQRMYLAKKSGRNAIFCTGGTVANLESDASSIVSGNVLV